MKFEPLKNVSVVQNYTKSSRREFFRYPISFAASGLLAGGGLSFSSSAIAGCGGNTRRAKKQIEQHRENVVKAGIDNKYVVGFVQGVGLVVAGNLVATSLGVVVSSPYVTILAVIGGAAVVGGSIYTGKTLKEFTVDTLEVVKEEIDKF